MRTAHLLGGVAIGLAVIGLGAAAASSRGDQQADARATLRLADGTRIGTVRFTDDDGLTLVRVALSVPPGATPVRTFHGFHVHANDVPANGEGCLADPTAPSSTWFVSADGHLKAPGQLHADHDGDLPSLQLNAAGRASATFSTERIAPNQLDGRVVILHAGPDNFANVAVGTAPDQYTANSEAAVDKTQATGNAGDRVACGVISLRR